MARVYYNEESGGEPRSVESNGSEIIFSPKGEKWVRERYIAKTYRSKITNRMTNLWKERLVKLEDVKGKPIDYHDLEPHFVRACFLSRYNSDGKLTLERPPMTQEDKIAEIARLTREVESAAGPGDVPEEKPAELSPKEKMVQEAVSKGLLKEYQARKMSKAELEKLLESALE